MIAEKNAGEAQQKARMHGTMQTGPLRSLRRAQVALTGFLEGVGDGSSASGVAFPGSLASGPDRIREFVPTCGETAPVRRSIPWNRLKLSTFLIPRSQFLQTSTDSGRPGKSGFVNDGHSFQHIWQSGITVAPFAGSSRWQSGYRRILPARAGTPILEASWPPG